MNRQIKYEDSVLNGNSTEEDTVNVMNGTVINEAEGNKKRSDYISWGDYFMGVAYLSARRSKDPRTQVCDHIHFPLPQGKFVCVCVYMFNQGMCGLDCMFVLFSEWIFCIVSR